MALREYVPGNRIYANGHQFVARLYHLESLVEPVQFVVDAANEAVVEVGTSREGAIPGMGVIGLRAVPICDVDLVHHSHIGDDEEFRFQLAVAVFAYEEGRHGEGMAYLWGKRRVSFRRGVHLRMVNVGASRNVPTGALGYPVCIVCGQSRSPFSSQAEQERFGADHRERCGRAVEPTGFYADAVVDAITLQGCADRDEAYSILEALRAGAESVLEMDREDLHLLTIGSAGTQEVDGLLYDPMPGGSGLLEQILERWGEVVDAARRVAGECPSGCVRSCADCLQTFRNAYYHRHLDRKVAAERMEEWGGALVFQHDIPARMPAVEPRGADVPVNVAERRLRGMLQRAGFPEGEWQKEIRLGLPLRSTRPDCFYPGEGANDPGVCIYLDGLSQHLHGNSETAARDRAIRTELRSMGYFVLEIAANDLDDRPKMASHFFQLARHLMGKREAQEIREREDWFPDRTGG